MRRSVPIVAVAAAALIAATPLWADAIPSRAPALEKRLGGFDPKAVAAARHYLEQPAIKAGMIDNLGKTVGQTVAKQNPSLPPDRGARLQAVADEALKERLDLLMRMSMVNALDVMSTDELRATDSFYSTPEGGGVLAKMPKLTAALPAMVQSIMPDYLADVQRRMKQNGAELKL